MGAKYISITKERKIPEPKHMKVTKDLEMTKNYVHNIQAMGVLFVSLNSYGVFFSSFCFLNENYYITD